MTMPTAPAGSTGYPWIDYLARNRRETAIGLFIAAGVLAILPLWLGLSLGKEYLFVTVWGLLPVLVAAGAGTFVLLMEPASETETANTLRLVALTVGGALGVLLVLLGGILLLQWWSTVFSGGLEAWRTHGWHFAATLASTFAGFILLFVSLQLARVDERNNSWMRQMLYGYNTVLTGILLLAILVILNVLSYTQVWPYKLLAEPADWTKVSFYKLSDASVNLLKGLDRPVKLYVLQLDDPTHSEDVQSLIDSCRAQTDKIEVEYLSADRNRRDVELLRTRYKVDVGRSGVLVVYGREGQESAAFISERELFPGAGMEGKQGFGGEDALMRWLSFLEEGRGGGGDEDNAIRIYVTQGNGEPPLSTLNPMGDRAQADGLDRLGTLLRDFHFRLQPLPLTEQTTTLPEDAEVVVVLPPRQPLPAAGVEALRKFARTENPKTKKKGKLFVLCGIVVNREGKVLQSGVESLLADFNVQVSNERILRIPDDLVDKPENFLEQLRSRSDQEKLLRLLATQLPVLPVTANPSSQNPVAKAFTSTDTERRAFTLADVRKVEAQQKGGPYQAEEIFRAQGTLWLEPELDPQDWIQSALVWWFRDRSSFKEVQKAEMPLAVAVTERTEPSPGQGGGVATPRLVVFGASSWIRNERLGANDYRIYLDLFRSCLAWLRERKDVGSWAQVKVRPGFQLPGGPGEEKLITRLYWLPAGMIILGIAGLGGFVWLTRRR